MRGRPFVRGEPGFRKMCLRTFEPANARRDAARRAGVEDQGGWMRDEGEGAYGP